jgi:hypothetical protein
MGRGSENLGKLARASRPSAAGPLGRVPRSADYTGGKIVVRERKGGALGVPRGEAAIATAPTPGGHY